MVNRSACSCRKSVCTKVLDERLPHNVHVCYRVEHLQDEEVEDLMPWKLLMERRGNGKGLASILIHLTSLDDQDEEMRKP